jgi:hypothetical protein
LADNTDNTHPYSLEVQPIPGSEGQFQWTIRKHGKMLQRSDRNHPSEAKARAHGREVIEKLLHGGDDRGF